MVEGKNMRPMIVKSIRVGLFGLPFVFAASLAIAEALSQPLDSDPETGGVLYQDNCASCHGEGLKGEADWQIPKDDGTLPAPPHDETGHTWHHGDALLFGYTKLGGQAALQQMGVDGFVSGMPAFEEMLDDQEIWNILAYIKSTWPERVREMQATRSKAEQLRGN